MNNKPKFWLVFFTFGFWFKAFLCYLAVYIGVAFGYSIFSPVNYRYSRDDFWAELATVMYRPTAKLFINNTVNSWPNYANYEYKTKMSEINSVTIRSENLTTVVNLIPATSQNWKLVYCKTAKNQCFIHKLEYSGSQYFVFNENVNVWALGSDGRFYNLNMIYQTNYNTNYVTFMT